MEYMPSSEEARAGQTKGPARLVISGETGDVTTFELPRGPAVVGRSTRADLTLGDDSVSGRHAVLTWDGSLLRVSDLGSTNGTTVNGTRIVDWVDLRDGDEIRFGATSGHIDLSIRRDSVVPDATAGPVLRPTAPDAARARWRSVFISYASEDQRTVQTISSYLQAQGWEVWFDQHALQPGEQWGRRIADAIARSSVVLAVVSPSTLRSQWVDAELQLARNNDRPILSLVVERTDLQAIQQRLGLYLGRQWMDLSEIGGRVGGPELEEVSLTLDALAREGSVKPPVPAMQRTGTAILFLGLIGLVASMAWMVVTFLGAAGSMGEFFGLLGPDANESAVFDAWRDAADEILSSFFVVPPLLASIVVIAVGIALRRSARRKSLRSR
jgi:hypothetical protein